MKRISILILITLISGYLKAQCPTDTISLDEGNFHVAFSISLKYPVKVYWHLTKNDVDCDNPLPRSNNFIADPQLPGTSFGADYSHSGYDQGHNFDAKDDACQTQIINAHCWYFTNMAPQHPKLNRIVWRNLEEQCRRWVREGDDLFIECGSYGHISDIGSHHVAVPAYCWKYIHHKDGHVDAYIMPNLPEVSQFPFTHYLVTISQLETATGLKF